MKENTSEVVSIFLRTIPSLITSEGEWKEESIGLGTLLRKYSAPVSYLDWIEGNTVTMEGDRSKHSGVL